MGAGSGTWGFAKTAVPYPQFPITLNRSRLGEPKFTTVPKVQFSGATGKITDRNAAIEDLGL